MLVTLKLECAPEVSENAIFTAIQATILGKPTRDVLLLDKGEALVTVDIRAESKLNFVVHYVTVKCCKQIFVLSLLETENKNLLSIFSY